MCFVTSIKTPNNTQIYKTNLLAMYCHVKHTHEDAVTPSRGSKQAAGYDLSSVHDTVIRPGESKIIDTGIAIEFEDDLIGAHYARVAPRSGLAAHHAIDVLAGVVDADYRDSIKVVLVNHGKVDFKVKKGDRIAQLIFEAIYTPKMVEVDDLSDTNRGINGFGSTGV